MYYKKQYLVIFLTGVCVAASVASAVASTVFSVDEDVMTSSFFSGANRVRGYDADDRNIHRVSTNIPFGVAGAETLYLDFGNADLSSFAGPVNAVLTVQSTSGQFGADAGPGNAFTVSAHAVNANPLTSITDDTNPGGTINWLDFYNNNIESADSLAITSIDSFGSITFNVSAIVNEWILSPTSFQSLALTGLNDTSGNDFLHGFLNNSENPGSTFLTVSAVPVPGAVWLMGSGLIAVIRLNRKSKVG